jgi:hypothetical protein
MTTRRKVPEAVCGRGGGGGAAGTGVKIVSSSGTVLGKVAVDLLNLLPMLHNYLDLGVEEFDGSQDFDVEPGGYRRPARGVHVH